MTLWDPDSKGKCIISGFLPALIATPLNTVNRMYTTVFMPTEIKSHISGGGVNLRIFSLKYLYEEHRLFRNCWSRSNDGFDLAKYNGTKFYLPPHLTQDYIFWWDTDLTRYDNTDFLRLHPAKILCGKNVIFVRNQTTGNNHRTKKVFIKPPANITSQWKFQSDWYDFPLFAWGVSLIDWKDPFHAEGAHFIPITEFDPNEVYKYTGGNPAWTKLTNLGIRLAYSPIVDPGNGNLISVGWVNTGSYPSNNTNWTEAMYTLNLPYWYSTFGQNISWDFGVQKTSADIGNQTWIMWKQPEWTVTQIEQAANKPKWETYCAVASVARTFAKMGWFTQATLDKKISIPFLYRSYWIWGGTQLTKQAITGLQPTTNQVSVKNPARVGESVIRPGDLRNGLLTANALRRFLEPSKFSDERRPEPYEEQPKRYASSEEYDETGSEAEESEEECTEKSNVPEILKCLSRRVQRERAKRRSLNKFFKSLLIGTQ